MHLDPEQLLSSPARLIHPLCRTLFWSAFPKMLVGSAARFRFLLTADLVPVLRHVSRCITALETGAPNVCGPKVAQNWNLGSARERLISEISGLYPEIRSTAPSTPRGRDPRWDLQVVVLSDTHQPRLQHFCALSGKKDCPELKSAQVVARLRFLRISRARLLFPLFYHGPLWR